VPLREVRAEAMARLPTGLGELDRVLGGGLVPGSLVLLGGSPGIGKSTLTAMALGHLETAGRRTLYVSGEESPAQIRLRAARLGEGALDVPVLAETDLATVLATLEAQRPDVCVIDSVQTLNDPQLTGAPGSVGQVREVAGAIARIAKAQDTAVVLVGHVTKEGALAGPRVLEHLVDCVLQFEGERERTYRTVRALKPVVCFDVGSPERAQAFLTACELVAEAPSRSVACTPRPSAAHVGAPTPCPPASSRVRAGGGHRRPRGGPCPGAGRRGIDQVKELSPRVHGSFTPAKHEALLARCGGSLSPSNGSGGVIERSGYLEARFAATGTESPQGGQGARHRVALRRLDLQRRWDRAAPLRWPSRRNRREGKIPAACAVWSDQRLDGGGTGCNDGSGSRWRAR
jgi:energy-coupling factor transporter ATP-binding protein EcfA2